MFYLCPMKPGTVACTVIAKLITHVDTIIAHSGAASREFERAFETLVTNYANYCALPYAVAASDCLACFPSLNSRYSIA